MAKPWLVGVLVDRLTSPGPLIHPWALMGLFLLAAGRALSLFAYGEASARLGLRTVSTVRRELVTHWLRSGRGGVSMGDALTRMGRDVGRLRSFTDRIYIRSVTGSIRALLPALVLIGLDPALSALALLFLPLQRWAVSRLERRIEDASRRASEAHAKLYEKVEAFLHHPTEAAATDVTEQSQRLEEEELRSARMQAAIKGAAAFGTGLGIACVWAAGSRQVATGTMTLGELVSFTGYVTLAYRPVRQLANVSKTYSAGSASLARVAETLDPHQHRSS